MFEKPRRLVFAAVAIAWIFDLLFWEKPPGISIALYALILGGGLLALALLEDRAPAASSYILLAAALALFALTAIRREPVTVALGLVLGTVLFGLLTDTFLDGAWLRFSFIAYLALPFRLAARLLAGAPAHLEEISNASGAHPSGGPRLRGALPYLRGGLLALPILFVFGALLASSDLVFADRLEAFLDLFRFENWIEFVFRLILISTLAYLLLGAYRHALAGSSPEKWNELKLPRFLGFTETVIVLGAVELLFAGFVAVQLRYFFGGRDQIAEAGYTYAEYARRGFGELVVVAIFSLGLFLALSAVTKRDRPGQRQAFSGLGVLLTVLVGTILASAFQRLLLYESAFGFTRLRTYPHIVMIWLGLLLVALAVLEGLGKTHRFALASLTAAFGFALSLGVANVDGMIAAQNVARARLGEIAAGDRGTGMRAEWLDTPYLMTLSTDAVPALVQAFDDPSTSVWLRDEIGAVLACQAQEIADERADLPWQGFHISRARAEALLAARAGALAAYPLSKGEFGDWQATANGETRSCHGSWLLGD